ncbi:MAG: BON domain-containing protein [Gammaproteobacteria bacterium]|nr:BON domain-containing protein [Gammaproteobacteria bacterium]MBU1775047.1 BON domain-containing protein [Gammaproteobacteria bacterium]
MRFLSVLILALAALSQGCAAPIVAAGVGAGLMASSDRRSAGAMVEDDTIESKSGKRIEEKYKDSARVSVTSYNRFALLSGEVQTEAARMDIERIVGSVPNVKGIANELVVGASTGLGTRSNDSFITSSVKARFVNSTAFKADHVKVVTESGVVYLMGLVTRAEADAASDIASTTRGVLKVVRVFEYID